MPEMQTLYGDQERVERIRGRLAEHKLDALICRLAENLVFLSGYYPNIGASLVVFPAQGEPVLIAPQFEEEFFTRGRVTDVRTYETWQLRFPDAFTAMGRLLTQVCQDKGLAGKRIGYEGAFEMVAPNMHCAEPTVPSLPTKRAIQVAAPGAVLHDATELLHEMRALKTPAEIERIRRANEVCCIGLNTFKELAQPGRSEAEVAAAVEAAVYAKGMECPGVRFARATAQVTSGPRTEVAWGYPISSNRRIQAGEMVQIEIAAVVDGYWCDLTRPVVAGKANARQHEVYELIKRAQQAAVEAIRPGMRGVAVDAVARGVIREAGLEEYFPHHTGHGVGFRYHEPFPALRPDSQHALVAGHVCAVEPGVYIPGFGACRIEEDYAVVQSGVEVLSHTDWGLD